MIALSNPHLETITIATNASRVRYASKDGRKYLVAPLTLIVPGVLSGSQGSLYYPPEEISKNYKAWHGMPLVHYHPVDSITNRHLSANDEGVNDRQGLGYFYYPAINQLGSLKGEAWFDIERTKAINNSLLTKLKAGKPIEISSGLFTDNEPAPEGSNYNGRSYTHIARNYRPDHVAILPDQVGACILPGQKIQGRISKASKAWYSGKAIRIKTASGRVLSVTTNHPILTREGFIPASEITEGSDLICYIGEDKTISHETFVIDPDKENAPALAEDIFKAFRSHFGSQKQVRASTLDFHGDAKFFQSKVEIIVAKRKLRSDEVSPFSESFKQGQLSRRSDSQSSLSSNRQVSISGRSTPSSDIGSMARFSHSGTFVRSGSSIPQSTSLSTRTDLNSMPTQDSVDSRPSGSDFSSNPYSTLAVDVVSDNNIDDPIREPTLRNLDLSSFCVFGPGAELDTSLTKPVSNSIMPVTSLSSQDRDRFPGKILTNPFVNSTPRDHLSSSIIPGLNSKSPQPIVDGSTTDSKLFSQLLHRFPSKVLSDKVVAVELFSHNGLVYDFESPLGYIIAENLIVSNCSLKDGCGVFNRRQALYSTVPPTISRLELPVTTPPVSNISYSTLRQADFVKLPASIPGTNCSNCKYESHGYCTYNQKVDLRGLPVNRETCCSFWDARGVQRQWSELSTITGNSSDPASLFATLLHASTSAHILHFNTRSVACHLAMDKFYKEFPLLVDSLVEAWQGLHSIVPTWPSGFEAPSGPPVEFVSSLKQYIESNRTVLGGESFIQNLVDEILAFIDQTSYQLRFLS